MTLIKKFAWYGSSVAFATVLALALLVTGPANVAEAAAPSANEITRTSEEALVVTTYTVAFTTVAALPTGNTITVDLTGAGGVGEIRQALGTTSTITFGAGFTGGASCTAVTTGTGGGATYASGTSTYVITLPAGCSIAALTAASLTISNVQNGAVAAAAVLGQTQTQTDNTNAPDGTTNATTNPTTVKAVVSASTVSAIGGSVTVQAALPTGLSVATASISGAGQFGINGTKNLSPVDNNTASGDNDATASNLNFLVVGDGTSGTSTITVNAAGSTVTLTVTFIGAAETVTLVPSLTTVPSTGATKSDIVVTVKDSAGKVVSGAAVSMVTTLGTFDGTVATGTITTCAAGSQSCTGTTDANGQFSPRFQGAGATGAATITATSNAKSGTATVTVSGTLSSITAKLQTNIGTPTAAWTDSNTPTSALYANNVRISVSALDASGNALTSQTAAASYSPSNCGPATSTTSNSTDLKTAFITFTAVPGTTPAVGTACTATVTVGTKTATVTWTIGGTTAATVEVAATDQAVATVGTVTATVKDAAGNLIGDGTSVTLVASAGAVATGTVVTKNGVATFTYVSPGTAQTVGLTAVTGSVNGSKNISVGGAVTPPPAGGPGTFVAAPSFGTGNVGSAVFQGGTIAELVAAVTAAGGTSVWIQDNGTWRSYNTLATGAAAFVNNGFNTAFAAGFGSTAVFVVK